MRSYRFCILCPVIVAVVAALAFLFSPPQAHGQTPVDPKKPVSFMDHVAPILKENCFACHNPKTRKGKFDMSTFEKLLAGGDRGEPVEPGKPEKSNLVLFLKGDDEPQMPPKEAGGLLAKDKVAIIERWVTEGAKFDGSAPTADLVTELRKRFVPPTPFDKYPSPWLVNALAFTPDNEKVVVGGYHELLVWDFNSGKLEKRIRTRAERALAMLFLPDGKTLVVAGARPGQEGDVRLYNLDAPNPKIVGNVKIYDGVDPKAGVMIRELLQVADQVLCLALSPDGKKLASGGCDNTVRVWDLTDDYKLEQSFENHGDWVFGLVFSSDEKHLLTCSRDDSARAWDLTTKESSATFPDHKNDVYSVAIKPDGKVGVSGGKDNEVRVWNAENGKQIRSMRGHTDAVWSVLYHPTKALVISCSADKTVRFWNPDNGQSLKSLEGHTDHVFALALSPDGNLVASGSYNGEVRVWKVDDGSLVKSFVASPGIQTSLK